MIIIFKFGGNMKSYKTEGRERLLHFLAVHPDEQFTAEELCTAVNGRAQSAQSSIYRRLGQLCADDIVRRFRSEDKQCSVYQYVGQNCDCKLHFHAKCVRCGRLEHLDCGDSADFAAHLLREHGCSVDCAQALLYGIFARCASGGSSS